MLEDVVLPDVDLLSNVAVFVMAVGASCRQDKVMSVRP